MREAVCTRVAGGEAGRFAVRRSVYSWAVIAPRPPFVRVPGSVPSSLLAIEIIDETAMVQEADRRWLIETLQEAGVHLHTQGELRIRVVGDGQMCELHARYCDDPTTTDVLTFDLGSEGVDGAAKGEASEAEGGAEAGEARVLDVDLVLCIDEAERQAKARGYPVRRELVLYALHGILHCLGYDDHDEDAFAKMHQREDAILEAIGVGRTFGSGEPPMAGSAA